MDSGRKTDDEQMALWNGAAGRSWVEAQDMLDEMFEPFEELLADVVAARPRAGVLDVGCGTGSTTLAFARRLGAEGSTTQSGPSPTSGERLETAPSSASSRGGAPPKTRS